MAIKICNIRSKKTGYFIYKKLFVFGGNYPRKLRNIPQIGPVTGNKKCQYMIPDHYIYIFLYLAERFVLYTRKIAINSFIRNTIY